MHLLVLANQSGLNWHKVGASHSEGGVSTQQTLIVITVGLESVYSPFRLQLSSEASINHSTA